ncbi:MAG: hypothetical protein IMW96_09210 [Thermoanaerobacteraceae bacterium]|uniref:hypothetical protein n=1 Tax=Thermanaeromonas sp. C210 TaxID=2731925 RepID=UPI00155BC122|nr:hypothetical protein [Thermanaeromonas sp. C210]MBE3581788.1 hypothetical protein [Thermoanaerobacteraceae bacterium]GFN22769.1 hypothetical protein TAMC210_10860 [Thermanaeromonas sp. C210]
MTEELVSADFLALIRSLKPYLGPRGVQCTELAETILDLLNTEQARKAQSAFLALREEKPQFSALKLLQGRANDPESGPCEEKDPFILFLILILLLLSTGALYKK